MKKLNAKKRARIHRDIAALIGKERKLNDCLEIISAKNEDETIQSFTRELSKKLAAGERSDLHALFEPTTLEILESEIDISTKEKLIFEIAEEIEIEREVEKRTIHALYYPLTIFTFFTAASFIAQIFILPVFYDMYSEFQKDPPSKIVIANTVVNTANYFIFIPILFFFKHPRKFLMRTLPFFRAVHKNERSMKTVRLYYIFSTLSYPKETVERLLLQSSKSSYSIESAFSNIAWYALQEATAERIELIVNERLSELRNLHRRLTDRISIISQAIGMILIGTLVWSIAYSILMPVFNLSSVAY